MSAAEWYIAGFVAVGWVIWLRGCVKRSAGDCSLGLLIGALGAAVYFFVFRMTHTPYLAAILLAAYVPVMVAVPRMRGTTLAKAFGAAAMVLAIGAGVMEYELVSMGNALLVIEPYRDGKMWRFDEPRLHLKGEPFVQGIPEMINVLVKDVPGAEKSVRLIFSQQAFPGAEFRLDRVREQDGGNWYYNEKYQMEGWLCPALFKFFPRAPEHLYVKVEGV